MKKYRFIDHNRNKEQELSLYGIVHATDFSENEIEDISNLKVDEHLEFDNGWLVIERIA